MGPSAPTGSARSFKQESVRSGSSTSEANARPRTAKVAPRSLPPWIDSYEVRRGTGTGGSITDDQFRLLTSPSPVVSPKHNAEPSALQRRLSRDGYEDWTTDPTLVQTGRQGAGPGLASLMVKHRTVERRGRKWDHLRTAEPVIVANFAPRPAPAGLVDTWTDFVHSSEYGRAINERSEVVDAEVLNKLQPNFNQPIDSPNSVYFSKQSRRRRTIALNRRVWHAVLHHSLSPLFFRLTVIVTSIIALSISSRMLMLEDLGGRDGEDQETGDGSGGGDALPDNRRERHNQTMFTIVVDVAAIPYVAYMLWDEYTGKPLGLRPPLWKTVLILCDLFFIILKSAGTSLAFEALLYDSRAVWPSPSESLDAAMAVFMVIGLASWTLTFAVNVMRTVERLGGGEEDDMR